MKKPRVIIIDDQKEDIEKAREVLGDMFEIGFVTKSSEAIKAIEKFKPDVVFLDIQMPGENGLQVLKKIKVVFPRLRVIMVTIVRDVNVAVQAAKAGAFDYVVKPLDSKVLLEKVNRAIEETVVEEDLEDIKQKAKRLRKKL
jgi:DNA-binding NtrC family response regulator